MFPRLPPRLPPRIGVTTVFPELSRPVIVAPMAGGPSTVGLVVEAARAGGLGFLAAGYKTPEATAREVAEVRAAGVPFGLNIFVPDTAPADAAEVARYRARLEKDHGPLPDPPLHDDDHFAEKLRIASGVPYVSFTFGLPPAEAVAGLRASGSTVLLTVTSADEARRALTTGPDALIAQAGTAGGHSGTFDPAGYDGAGTALGLLRTMPDAVPIVAAGGTGSAAGVRELLDAGATAVQAGTAFLLADEAGTRAAHRVALTEARETVVTRAFTGRPARALRNHFTDVYGPYAPLAYPAVHHLTASIRAAAAARNDAESINLWAGTAYADARPGPAGGILRTLAGCK
ncbi:nitronate monooxygenase [Catenuloplanes nepalensis]|uniref:Propionate 3-nitronate monooxygenase n=1 Tax=Catenuloplanes nepalensis TaxID=587533 RepID=A0ABT9MX55_9ACTN|nr:nitronate monooxygenase [Catenuloplanes nepalensis]MDP9795826.1 nitronate monooxygenase [Catenuloplanes nepalensis]